MDGLAAAPVGRPGGPRARRLRRSLLGVGGVGLAILLVLSACIAGQDAATTPGVPDVTAVHGPPADLELPVSSTSAWRLMGPPATGPRPRRALP
jgi:hypothetical protein